jgi:uncharacterized protein YbjT (DUF2867 family)
MHRALIVGATGAVGGAVAEQLVAAGVPNVSALSRNPEAAHLPSGVEVVRGDLTMPESLENGLAGVDAVFLVWTAPPTAVLAAIERIARTARRIVFLSSPHKTPHPLFQQPNPMRALHAQIEAVIISSGLDWTFLRPGMFARNCLTWWAPSIRSGDVVRWPYLRVPTAPIDERDIAAVAVRALCEDGHAGAEYVLTGPQSLTQAEQLSTIGQASGRDIKVDEISPEKARKELLSIMPAVAIEMLLSAWAAAEGQPAFVSNTFSEVMGAPPRSFSDWVVDHAHEFIGTA